MIKHLVAKLFGIPSREAISQHLTASLLKSLDHQRLLLRQLKVSRTELEVLLVLHQTPGGMTLHDLEAYFDFVTMAYLDRVIRGLQQRTYIIRSANRQGIVGYHTSVSVRLQITDALDTTTL